MTKLQIFTFITSIPVGAAGAYLFFRIGQWYGRKFKS